MANSTQQREQAVSTLGMDVTWLYDSMEAEPNDPCDLLEAAQEAAWATDPTGKHVKALTARYLAAMAA